LDGRITNCGNEVHTCTPPNKQFDMTPYLCIINDIQSRLNNMIDKVYSMEQQMITLNNIFEQLLRHYIPTACRASVNLY
jgi:hypothetical protein